MRSASPSTTSSGLIQIQELTDGVVIEGFDAGGLGQKDCNDCDDNIIAEEHQM